MNGRIFRIGQFSFQNKIIYGLRIIKGYRYRKRSWKRNKKKKLYKLESRKIRKEKSFINSLYINKIIEKEGRWENGFE